MDKSKFTPIDEIVAEHEKDPERKRLLDEARAWLREYLAPSPTPQDKG